MSAYDCRQHVLHTLTHAERVALYPFSNSNLEGTALTAVLAKLGTAGGRGSERGSGQHAAWRHGTPKAGRSVYLHKNHHHPSSTWGEFEITKAVVVLIAVVFIAHGELCRVVWGPTLR